MEHGETFLLQLMDQLVAIPTGIYPYERSGTHNDIHLDRVNILLYVTSCPACLHQCKATGRPRC